MTAWPRAPVSGCSHRLIASRWPTTGVFDDLTADEEELRIAFILEGLTDDSLAPAVRHLALLPPGEIVPSTLIMSAFLHADPAGGRFTEERLEAWYASLAVETAIAETLYHHHRRLALSAGGFPQTIQMRQLIAEINTELIDIRGMQITRPDLYHLTDYSASQEFGTSLRWRDGIIAENGLVYDSVRHAGGTNVCLYRPSLVGRPSQSDYFEYRWDARGQVTVVKLTPLG